MGIVRIIGKIRGSKAGKLFRLDRRKNTTRLGAGMPDLKPGDTSFTRAKTYLIKGGSQKPDRRAGQK
ncbi:MAG: hypothetical protein V1676_02320 [Candidatus Diapherotrites archaeon]